MQNVYATSGKAASYGVRGYIPIPPSQMIARRIERVNQRLGGDNRLRRFHQASLHIELQLLRRKRPTSLDVFRRQLVLRGRPLLPFVHLSKVIVRDVTNERHLGHQREPIKRLVIGNARRGAHSYTAHQLS